MEQHGIQVIVKRREVVLDDRWIDSRGELDLIPDVPIVDELPVRGKERNGSSTGNCQRGSQP